MSDMIDTMNGLLHGYLLVGMLVAVLVIFAGSQFKAALAWNLADLMMGVMALINIPVCVILGRKAYLALGDYLAQRAAGRELSFEPRALYGVDEGMECWNRGKEGMSK